MEIDRQNLTNSTSQANDFPITGIVKSNKLLQLSQKPDTIDTKVINYIIDSRDRNRSLCPSSSNYTVPLSEEYRDVKEIELLSVQFPKVTYTINKNNDKLKLFFGDQSCDVTLLHGRYKEGEDLAKAVETTINDNRPPDSPRFVVDYIKHLHKLIIRNPCIVKDKKVNVKGFLTLDFEGNKCCYGDGNQFETKYPTKCCGEVLGFDPKVYDMYAGQVFLNPINENDSMLLRDSNESDIDEIDSGDIDNGDIDSGEGNTGQKRSPCNEPDTVQYVLRGDNIQLSKFLLRPVTGDCLTCQVDYVFIRSGNSPFIPAKVISKYTCRNPRFSLSNEVDSWIVEIDKYWELTHGQFEMFTDYIVSDKIIELNPHKYVLLKIPKCHRFQSLDKDTQSSFAKIPLQGNEYHLANFNAPGNIKRFNPPIPLLDKLRIQWLSYTSSLDNSGSEEFDFAGGEHVIELAIVYYRQPLKYSQTS